MADPTIAEVAGALIETARKAQASGGGPFPFGPNDAPLGSATGAPPRTWVRTYQVVPAAAGGEPTLVVPATRENRVAVFIAPIIGFSVFIGEPGINTGTGMALSPGIPYDMVIPPDQAIYAITDAPTYIPLRVQVGPILVADRERKI